jgi:hypothetical protein
VRGEKFVAINFHKIVHYFIFEMLKKKNLGQFSKYYRTFYPSSHKYGFVIRDPEKPISDPGSRGQKGTGFWIPDPDPQQRHFRFIVVVLCRAINVELYVNTGYHT